MCENRPITTRRLGELLDRLDHLPSVSLELPEQRLPAVLLVWGRPAGAAWVAGVSYLERTWHRRGLVTMWAPAGRVSPHPQADYRYVPRVALPADPTRWPTLPPRYPNVTAEWVAAHRHTVYGQG